jgi:hypothetical protein
MQNSKIPENEPDEKELALSLRKLILKESTFQRGDFL